jgi:hypothetical protein
MRDLSPLTLSDFDAAPIIIRSVSELDAPLPAVFKELADPSGWFPLMSSCTWQGRVGGVGSAREVVVRTFGTFREEMIAWDTDHCVAFTMTKSNSPLVKQMGEEFVIEKSGKGTHLTWRMVIYPSLAGRAVAPVLRVIVKRMARTAAKRLARAARS